MRISLQHLPQRIACRLLRPTIQGPVFRQLVPQSPSAKSVAPQKLAICDLIPNLGDKVMVFPLLDALRAQNPTLEISYFTSGGGAVIGMHPAVDHLYVMPPDPNPYPHPVASVLALWRWWKRDLSALRFHIVVVLRGGVDPTHSHHLAWLLGGRKRVAYSTLLEPERAPYQFNVASLFTAQVTQMDGIHEVERGAEVLRLAGLLRAPVDLTQPVRSIVALANQASSLEFLHRLQLMTTPYAVLSPGASTPRRAWPVADFVELVRRQFLPHGWLPVIVGGPELAGVAAAITQQLGCETLDLTGKTDLPQLAAVCAYARCFLGNDSGTAHVSGATGTPTLIVTAFARSSRLSHHASPARSHPLGPRVAVVQPRLQLAPCTTECVATAPHCITQISVDEVEQALLTLIGERTGALPSSYPDTVARLANREVGRS